MRTLVSSPNNDPIYDCNCGCGGSIVAYDASSYRASEMRHLFLSVPREYRAITVWMSVVLVVAAAAIIYATLSHHETNRTLWAIIMMILLWLALVWLIVHSYYSGRLPEELRISLSVAIRLNLWNTVWGNIAVLVCSLSGWAIDDMLALYGILSAPAIVTMAYVGVECLWYYENGRLARELQLYRVFRALPKTPRNHSVRYEI